MGRFADVHIADLTNAELDQYEALLEVQEHELLGWVMGQIDVPPDQDSGVFRRMRDFHLKNGQ